MSDAKMFTMIQRILPCQHLFFLSPLLLYILRFPTSPFYRIREFTWLTYQLTARDGRKAAIKHSARFRNGYPLSEMSCGGWHFRWWKKEEGKEYLGKEEGKLTYKYHQVLHLPPYYCACVSRRIRGQRGGGGAKGLILLAPPPPRCNMMRRLQPLECTLNKYTIKYSAYIYIYIFHIYI